MKRLAIPFFPLAIAAVVVVGCEKELEIVEKIVEVPVVEERIVEVEVEKVVEVEVEVERVVEVETLHI